MRKLFLLLSLVIFTTSGVVVAADSEQIIAVVDVKKILDKSSATKTIQKQIESKRKKIQDEIAKQEEGLRKTDKDLAKQRTVLAKEVFDKKIKEFKTEVVEAQRNVQTKRTQLEKSYAKALGEVEKVVISIIAEIADKKGFLIAVPKSNTLYARKGIDISEEVLKTLNERLPKVKVKLEK